MNNDIVFRMATTDDAPNLAEKIHEVSPEVVDFLVKGLLPGIGVYEILTMVMRDESSHFSYKNCVLAEIKNKTAGLLFAYPAEKQNIPQLMEHLLPSSRLDPLRELLTLKVPGSLYINTLWVDSTFRGMGIADALLNYAKYWAVEAGMNGISLFAWRDNVRAVAFYRKHGFTPVLELSASIALRDKHEYGDLYNLKLEKSTVTMA